MAEMEENRAIEEGMSEIELCWMAGSDTGEEGGGRGSLRRL